jgi:hypothetical protein
MSINFPGDETNYPENVRLLEESDPVLGGEDGYDNLAAQDLADRTSYLQARRIDDYRAGIEAASGGMATVKADDNGNWHVMARIPAFKSEVFDADFEYDGGDQYHPAFRLDASTVVPEILIGLFPVSLSPPDFMGNSDLLTLPGMDPDLTKTHDQAREFCAALGDGFHMMTIHEWGALAFWAFNLVQNLRGNSSANVITDQEYGVKSSVTDTQILTGTGPLSWKHSGREFGVSDLVAGVQEMINLCRTVDCKIHFPQYNEFWKEPADWDDQEIWFGPSLGLTLVIRGSAPNADDVTYETNFDGMEFANMTPGSLPVSLTDPRLCELLFDRTWYTDGIPPTDHEIAWLNNRIGVMAFPNSAGTRYLTRGGAYADGADAGLPTMGSITTAETGCQYRVAWIDPDLIPT